MKSIAVFAICSLGDLLLDSLKVKSEHELRTPITAQCDEEKAYCGKGIVVLRDKLSAAQAEAAEGNLAEEAPRVSNVWKGKLDAENTLVLGKLLTTPSLSEAEGIHLDHTATCKNKAQSAVELVLVLIHKFTAELAENQGQMNNMQKAHDVLIQHLIGWKAENVKLTALHEADATTQRQPLATANSVILESTKLLSDNTNFLGVVRRACKTKADEWEQRSSTRASEQAAIQEAKEIPAESEVKHFKVFAQFPDMHESCCSSPPGRSQSAQHCSTRDGHFDAVLNDTEKMVFNLNEEQLYEDQVFQKLDAEFHRRTPQRSST